MKVIFLDIDGVLNCSSSRSHCGCYLGIDNAKVVLLKQIVEKTGAKIVLVSTWKCGWYRSVSDKYQQDELANYLDRKLARVGLKAYDKTHDSYKGVYYSRGEGILDYLNVKQVEAFVIIDDLQFDYDGCGLTDNFVKTDSNFGLTEEGVQKAIIVLEKA